jgi:hypothetical protein
MTPRRSPNRSHAAEPAAPPLPGGDVAIVHRADMKCDDDGKGDSLVMPAPDG